MIPPRFHSAQITRTLVLYVDPVLSQDLTDRLRHFRGGTGSRCVGDERSAAHGAPPLVLAPSDSVSIMVAGREQKVTEHGAARPGIPQTTVPADATLSRPGRDI